MEFIINPIFFEKVLLKFILTDEEIRDKVFPYLVADIFTSFECKVITEEIFKYNAKFALCPTIKELKVALTKDDNSEAYDVLIEISKLDLSEYKHDFLLDQIEQFFQQKLAWLELSEGVEQLKEGNIETLNGTSDRIKSAINFSFNTNLGLAPFSKSGAKTMYEHIHQKNNVIKTGLTDFDVIMNGGIHVPSLTVLIAESNMGKSLIKSAVASNMVLANKNILYLHGELSEPYMAERSVRNLLDLTEEELKALPEKVFYKRFEEMAEKAGNHIKFKRFAPGSFNVNHMRQLMSDFKIKHNFVPDLIMLDYLGLFAPASCNKNANSNEKGTVKCQELQGFIADYNIPILTSAQANRGGYGKSKLDPTNIADAIGIFAEADVVIGVTQTEEQRELIIPIYSWDVLKTRFGLNKKHVSIGINYAKMKLLNVTDDNDAEIVNINNSIENSVVSEATKNIMNGIKKEKKHKRDLIIEM